MASNAPLGNDGGDGTPWAAWQVPAQRRLLAQVEQDQQSALDAGTGAHVDGWPFSPWEQVRVLGLTKCKDLQAGLEYEQFYYRS